MLNTIIQGDCLDVMKEIPDGSIDLIVTDPPYGTVGGIGKGIEKYSRLTESKWDTALPINNVFLEAERMLRMNGCLILFSQEPYTSKLITQANGNLPFSYRMVWKKDHFANCLLVNKAPVSYYEDIVIFFKTYDSGRNHPLYDYADSVFKFIGKTKKEIFTEMGNQGAFHFFLGKGSFQFDLCTEKTYSKLIELYEIDNMEGFKNYEELQEIHRGFNRRFNRRFNLPEGKKYKSNVLEYKKDYDGFHPTQKPINLIEDLVYTYSNEGDTVLDFTAGSGTTGVACKNLNRNYILIEKEPEYVEICKERLK